MGNARLVVALLARRRAVGRELVNRRGDRLEEPVRRVVPLLDRESLHVDAVAAQWDVSEVAVSVAAAQGGQWLSCPDLAQRLAGDGPERIEPVVVEITGLDRPVPQDGDGGPRLLAHHIGPRREGIDPQVVDGFFAAAPRDVRLDLYPIYLGNGAPLTEPFLQLVLVLLLADHLKDDPGVRRAGERAIFKQLMDALLC